MAGSDSRINVFVTYISNAYSHDPSLLLKLLEDSEFSYKSIVKLRDVTKGNPPLPINGHVKFMIQGSANNSQDTPPVKQDARVDASKPVPNARTVVTLFVKANDTTHLKVFKETISTSDSLQWTMLQARGAEFCVYCKDLSHPRAHCEVAPSCTICDSKTHFAASCGRTVKNRREYTHISHPAISLPASTKLSPQIALSRYNASRPLPSLQKKKQAALKSIS